jgi:triacylglycerol lipase
MRNLGLATTRTLTCGLALMLAGCGTVLQSPKLSPKRESGGSLHAQVRTALQFEFSRWDTDSDGFVSRAELPTTGTAEFSALDRNRDGKLTFSEGMPAEAERTLMRNFAKLPASTTQADANKVLGALGWFDWLWRKKQPAPTSPLGRKPILLIPGYFEPGSMWASFSGELRRRGWTQIYVMEHWPGFSDIREMATKAGALVDKIQAETGATQIDIVGHSMGGLVARHWLQRQGGEGRIAHYVSFATPHQGTIAGYFGPGESARQMRPGSAFLNDINSGDTQPGDAHFASLWSRTDEIVVPQPHGEYKGGSDSQFPMAEHLQLAWLPAAQDKAIEELSK